MPEFVQKRPACEAHQLTSDNASDVASWCGGMVLPDGSVMAPTAEVGIIIKVGEYAVKRPGADVVKMSAAEFEATWEPSA